MFVNPAGSGKGYQIANAVRFRSAASAYFSRTFGTPTDATRFTLSFWVKLGAITADNPLFSAAFDANNYFNLYHGGSSLNGSIRVAYAISGTAYNATTNALRRDPSGWYHIVYVADTNNATLANRAQVWINGEAQTFTTNTLPQTSSLKANTATTHYFGRWGNTAAYGDQVMSEIYFIDGYKTGTTLATYTDFGEPNSDGVWVPKKYTGTYGNNGFYLDFSDGTSATTLGYDRSGNGNNWTASGISTTAGVTYDWLTDTPTNNYCVLNAVANFAGSTLGDGNLKLTPAGAGYYCNAATFTVSSGKWYWEMTASGPNWNAVGVAKVGSSDITTSGRYLGQASDAWSAFVENASTPLKKYNNGSATAFSPAIGPVAAGDIIQVALDADNGKIFFGYNGTWCDSSDPAAGTNPAFSGLTGPFTPAVSASSVSKPLNLNLGQGALTSGASYYSAAGGTFKYSPPTGFKALCTANLPAVAIPNPRKHFDVLTWTGASTASGRTFTGLQFPPDFVWSKTRSPSAYNHQLYDVVRGTGKLLSSNLTDAEYTNRIYGYISAFNSDGFTTVAGSTSNENWNELNTTYVGWNWKANGSGVTNTDGSITSTVSANTTAGFSIGTYDATGANATVGHGLGVAPKMIIIKNRYAANSWVVWHAGIANTEVLLLNSTNAKTTDTAAWNSTSPTSTVFSLGTGAAADTNQTNASSQDHWFAAFAEIPGYSKFGSYTGNGSTDGPFVFCGFRPRYVLVKATTAISGNWVLLDTARDPENVMDAAGIYANLANAETTSALIDATANGFKIRNNSTNMNNSGSDTYIYAAFAEHPFGGSNVSPSCAR